MCELRSDRGGHDSSACETVFKVCDGQHSGSAVVVVPEVSRALVGEMAGLVKLFGGSGRLTPRGSQVRTGTLMQPATSHGNTCIDAEIADLIIQSVHLGRSIEKGPDSLAGPMSGPQPSWPAPRATPSVAVGLRHAAGLRRGLLLVSTGVETAHMKRQNGRLQLPPLTCSMDRCL